ncbi:MAG: PrsW family glutamic-type intramembrane protease, partial [Bacteroidota bacterium]
LLPARMPVDGMTFNTVVSVVVSILPVFLFLFALVFLDSYKLVHLRAILRTIIVGCLVALACFGMNTFLVRTFSLDVVLYTRYGAPVVEECFKAFYVYYLIRAAKIGFLVDAAIYGFAVGAGFAFVENLYYIHSLEEANLLVWFVRGFGTAVMHGGGTAIVGILSKSLADRRSTTGPAILLPGLGIAIVVHSVYNHFFFSPLLSTFGIILTLPVLIMVLFERSEKATREWLGVELDTEMELLELINGGNISSTKIGRYLRTLEHRFRGEVIADLLCYLRVHLELSIQAKGILMMRDSGFDIPPSPEIHEQLNELKYLDKSIGRTGKLALKPFLRTSTQTLWQLHMLGGK